MNAARSLISTTSIAAMLLVLPQLGMAQGRSDAAKAPPIPCVKLAERYQAQDAQLQAERVMITSAQMVAAIPNGSATTPAYCDVRGTISGNIQFALQLPARWNGRFQMVGNGGKAGNLELSDMAAALKLGYAAASTNTGHDNSVAGEGGAQFGNDAIFGKEREIDFGYRAVHLTAVAAKEIVEAHYPKPIAYSYWNGCSTGGRQGLMEAQRYPGDFDGYAIGSPVYNYSGQQMTAPAVLQPLYRKLPATAPEDGPILSPAKRDMVGQAVYARCDAIDGLVDGQLRNPLACDFDPARDIPSCSAGSDENCLTNAELTALQAVYAGKPPYVPPMPVGSENTPGGWSTWVLPNSRGGNPGTPLLHPIMVDAFEYLMFNPDKPGFDYLTQFDWDIHPHQMTEAEQIYNATDPDLRDFIDSGRKVIMYHGWGDAGANPLRSIHYRQAVAGMVGEGYLDQFLKLYMVPGMGHCGGGQGHSEIDWLTPLVNWVEKGQQPEEVVGAVGTSTRPHCPYPEEAVYDGTGDPNQAASFSCQLPQAPAI